VKASWSLFSPLPATLPSTTAVPARMARQTTLHSLPNDVLLAIVEALEPDHLPACMRLSATNKNCREACRPLQQRVERRRILFAEDKTAGHVITNAGRTLTRLGGKWTKAWAVGTPLPSSGSVSWRMKIDRCAENEGVMCIGVCDADGQKAYGLSPYSGTLSSLSCDRLGATVTANSSAPPQHAQCVFTKQLMETADGAPSSLKGRANGAIIEMTFDADRGSVFMRVNRGSRVCAIAGLPPGTQLRPWARLFDVADRVSVSGFWTAA